MIDTSDYVLHVIQSTPWHLTAFDVAHLFLLEYSRLDHMFLQNVAHFSFVSILREGATELLFVF